MHARQAFVPASSGENSGLRRAIILHSRCYRAAACAGQPRAKIGHFRRTEESCHAHTIRFKKSRMIQRLVLMMSQRECFCLLLLCASCGDNVKAELYGDSNVSSTSTQEISCLEVCRHVGMQHQLLQTTIKELELTNAVWRHRALAAEALLGKLPGRQRRYRALHMRTAIRSVKNGSDTQLQDEKPHSASDIASAVSGFILLLQTSFGLCMIVPIPKEMGGKLARKVFLSLLSKIMKWKAFRRLTYGLVVVSLYSIVRSHHLSITTDYEAQQRAIQDRNISVLVVVLVAVFFSVHFWRKRKQPKRKSTYPSPSTPRKAKNMFNIGITNSRPLFAPWRTFCGISGNSMACNAAQSQNLSPSTPTTSTRRRLTRVNSDSTVTSCSSIGEEYPTFDLPSPDKGPSTQSKLMRIRTWIMSGYKGNVESAETGSPQVNSFMRTSSSQGMFARTPSSEGVSR